MINLVMQELKMSRTPVSLASLSEKLNIERSALEGMLSFWVQKGRLRENNQENGGLQSDGLACGSCGTSCVGMDDCTFIAKMPKIYSVAMENRNKAEND